MSGPRVILVTQRFWPLVGSTATIVGNLAVALKQCGAQPTIITPAWHADWPEHFVHREIPILRLARHSRGFWGAYRFARALAHWFREHHNDVDAVYVSALDECSATVLRALAGTRVRVMVRVSSANLSSRGNRITRQVQRLMSKPRKCPPVWLASSPHIQAKMFAAGLPDRHTRMIADGICATTPRTAATRFQAREALAEINHDLAVAEYAPVVAYLGRLEADKALHDLIRAWQPIAEGLPSATLWLVGDGNERQACYEQAVDAGIHHQVRLPGTFDDVHEILQAVDIFVNPSPVETSNLATLEAMAAGLPIAAADSEIHRWYLDDGRCGRLISPGTPSNWIHQMRQLLDDPVLANRLGMAAQQRVVAHYSIERMATDVLQICDENL